MDLFVGFLGLKGFLLLINYTSTVSLPLGCLVWNPLVFILSLVYPYIEYFDAGLLIRCFRLNNSCSSFLYLCGHLLASSWPSSTRFLTAWMTYANGWSCFSSTLSSSLEVPLLCRNYLPYPSLKLAFLLKMSIPTFSASTLDCVRYAWFKRWIYRIIFNCHFCGPDSGFPN